MTLKIVRSDITKMKTDAIVSAVSPSFDGSGGAEASIRRAAGPELDEALKALGGCGVGEARITKGYGLPCRYIIHTAGPHWRGGGFGEYDKLKGCYSNSLKLALANGCSSVAFPLISSGAHGFPQELALHAAMDAISGFLFKYDGVSVYIVVFDRAAFRTGLKLFPDIEEYIDDRYADAHSDSAREKLRRSRYLSENEGQAPRGSALRPPIAEAISCMSAATLDDALKQVDESFSQMLLRKIGEKGITEATCYKRANIDRKLFSKIRSSVCYKPSKQTALAFAVALELPLDETNEMLMKAGFALSHSSKFDIIIEYFIKNKNYDIFEINEALFAFDQSLLGG